MNNTIFLDIKHWPLYPQIIYYSFTLDTDELMMNGVLIKDQTKINEIFPNTN